MPYPFTFTDPYAGNSYADVPDVQAYFMTYKISTDDYGTVRQARSFLMSCSAEIDAVILARGGLVPIPTTSALLPILRQAAAIGAAALIAHARSETGDETMGMHATSLNSMYDAQLGLIERSDINLLLMGVTSGGWAVTADRRQYYRSGNLDQDRNGNQKQPFFTAQDQY